MDNTPPQTLKSLFSQAEHKRRGLESGRPSFDPANPAPYYDAVSSAVRLYGESARLADRLGVFSPNEELDDLATADLPYLLAGYHLGELAQRLPSLSALASSSQKSLSTPSSPPSPLSPSQASGAAVRPPQLPQPSERLHVLQASREAYERFLHLLDGYGLLGGPYRKLLERYTEEPERFSATGAGRDGGMAARRDAKIANLRAEKGLRAMVQEMERRQEEARRRRKRQVRSDVGSGTGNGILRDGQQGRKHRDAGAEKDEEANNEEVGEQEGEEEEEGEEGEDGGVDDEVARATRLAQIGLAAHMTFQALEGICRESELLAMAPPPQPSSSDPRAAASNGPASDPRQRSNNNKNNNSGQDEAFTERLDAPLRNLSLSGGGPILSRQGKPLRPFTLVGDRRELARGVFRPGHNLPTMSIDEYLEEEKRRGGIIQGGNSGPGSREAVAEKEAVDDDDMDRADAETMKARAWDEFKEENPRGSGNTLNRG